MPQASAVWSADPQQMWSFPASFMAEFFANHGMYSLRDRPRWRTVCGGSARYVEAITEPFADRIRTGAPVRSITRLPGGVLVEAEGCESEIFDEVVIATHSDQALAMLADPSDSEREILGAIPYQRNEAVLHTDPSLMPRRRRAWASWNFHLTPEPAGRTTVTYWMNNLQRLDAERDYFVTLNRGAAIDPEQVIGRFSYSHPVYTKEGVHAQERHAEINGTDRTRYCGAYWGWGFHEDGVVERDPRLRGRTGASGGAGVSAPGSAVFEGWVRHRRFEPVEHSFRYRLFLPYLDLDRLPELLDPFPLWSARRPAPARFRRGDYMGDPERPLSECARDLVAERTGARPGGPVRMLANVRCFGHVFNPIALYYCFDAADERVEAVVADVNNIPWGERHPYVLARGERAGRVLSDDLPKELHVSPLMGMDQTYSFRATEPGVRADRPHRLQRRRGQGLRRDPLAAAPRADPDADGRAARPLPGDVAAGGRPDLRPVAAAEAEGRPLLPPPAAAGARRGFISP